MAKRPKKKPTTKIIEMVVRVRVPVRATAAMARAEVRSLIDDQCNFQLDNYEVHAVSV